MPFDEEDAALLGILARQAATLLEPQAVAGEPAPESAQEVAPLAADPDAELARSVCEAVTSEIEPARVLDAALRAVARELGAAPASLYLLDPGGGELVLEGQCDAAQRSDRARLPVSGGLTGNVLETGHLIAAGAPKSDPRFDPAVDTPEDGRPGPLLCLPLRFRGKMLGVFRAFPADPSAVSPRTGEVLAAALSAAVRNVLLYRSLLDAIEEVARARRESQSG
jgi:GAF domain-containing protein